MIQVYCVLLVGEPLLLDGGEFGFYRNEYVVARSDVRAIDAAKAKAMKRLERSATKFVEGKPFSLKVENIKAGMPPWRLLRNEGFIFFPTDEQETSESLL